MRNAIFVCCLLTITGALPAAAAGKAPPAHAAAAASRSSIQKVAAPARGKAPAPIRGARMPVSARAAAPDGGKHPPAPARAAARTHAETSRTLIIAIDAGHGGKDTGAIGPNGTLEKHVVLAIARRLEAMIRAQPGMRPAMIRRHDEFIELRDRSDRARKLNADLFISLHADAYENGEAKGSSVFTLSRSGASSEAARWLASSENTADLVGGVKLKGRGRILASVLLNLAQNASIEASDRAAVRILEELQKSNRLHQRQIQKAGFVVLKSPDVPSLLVETAFISNAEEEKNLINPKYQEMVARSIFNGVRSYFSRNRPKLAPPRTAAATAEDPLRLASRQ